MAKTSQVVRNNKRNELIKRHWSRRQELKKIIRNPESTHEQREDAYRQMRKLPRDSSPVRFKFRCVLTGRAHAYYRRFGLSRVVFRELAHKGEIPGVKKASW